MTGFRTTASHDIINHQFDQLGEHYEQFGALIGPQAAIETVIGGSGEDRDLHRKKPIDSKSLFPLTKFYFVYRLNKVYVMCLEIM